MAINVKPIDQSAEKFERNAANASSDYVRGTENPKRPWLESSLAAEPNYKTQVVAAANAGRFGSGLRKAGLASWKGGIAKKGKANYETGIAGAGMDWSEGFRPYHAAIAALNLTPRGARNSQDNYRRSQAVGQAQSELKQRMIK